MAAVISQIVLLHFSIDFLFADFPKKEDHRSGGGIQGGGEQ